jgi:hypothetical protein
VLQITPNITHEKVFHSHLKSSIHTIRTSPTTNLPQLPRTTAVSHRELTRKRASVSPINPCSDTRETLLKSVMQLLRHCWNAWRHCWRCHVTPPHSCVIQAFTAVARQQRRRGDARQRATRQGLAEPSPARHGENTVWSTAAQSRERASTSQFLHGLNTPQY